MTLKEAIRINEENEILQREDGFEGSAKATQLGIEALKWRQHCELVHSPAQYKPLPGETEE